MISYLKTFLLALISAPFAALPVSHGAHLRFCQTCCILPARSKATAAGSITR